VKLRRRDVLEVSTGERFGRGRGAALREKVVAEASGEEQSST